MAFVHKHHIIPRHMGGTDDISNLVEVSIHKHAELHKQLYDDLGDWRDLIAYQMLSGQITCYEATIETIKRTNTGRKHTDEEKRKISEAQKGRKHSIETRRKIAMSNTGKTMTEENKKKMGERSRGRQHTPEVCEKIRNTHLGKPKSMEQRAKMAESAKIAWDKRRGDSHGHV